MQSITRRAVFLKLQQTVLDCEDNSLLLDALLRDSFSSLSIAGLDYLFIGGVFFDKELKVSKTCFYDENTQNNISDDNLHVGPVSVERIIVQESYEKTKLLKNEIAISEKIDEYISEKYPSFDKVKSLILSPVHVKGQLTGVIILASIRGSNSIEDSEIELIEIFTNLVAFTHRLQETEESLSSITEEVYKMNAKLHQLDKLKDEFVSVASHELRTPMTAIKSFLWMALNKQKENMNADLKRYLDHAYVSTQRLINLVNDMLNISRIEGGRIALKLSEVDLVAFANDICEELAPKASEKNISLKSIAAQMPKVLCDADKIHEVFINFIGNSLKFTPEGGKIWIDFKTDKDMVVVNINDSGRGISKEDMSKLFTKFGRLDNSYVKVAESSGTGLGLYITKSLVEFHKGEVFARSEGLEKGSVFSFSLPVVGSKTAETLLETAPKETMETKELEKTSINL